MANYEQRPKPGSSFGSKMFKDPPASEAAAEAFGKRQSGTSRGFAESSTKHWPENLRAAFLRGHDSRGDSTMANLDCSKLDAMLAACDAMGARLDACERGDAQARLDADEPKYNAEAVNKSINSAYKGTKGPSGKQRSVTHALLKGNSRSDADPADALTDPLGPLKRKVAHLKDKLGTVAKDREVEDLKQELALAEEELAGESEAQAVKGAAEGEKAKSDAKGDADTKPFKLYFNEKGGMRSSETIRAADLAEAKSKLLARHPGAKNIEQLSA